MRVIAPSVRICRRSGSASKSHLLGTSGSPEPANLRPPFPATSVVSFVVRASLVHPQHPVSRRFRKRSVSRLLPEFRCRSPSTVLVYSLLLEDFSSVESDTTRNPLGRKGFASIICCGNGVFLWKLWKCNPNCTGPDAKGLSAVAGAPSWSTFKWPEFLKFKQMWARKFEFGKAARLRDRIKEFRSKEFLFS